ncbi:MAG: NUDIX hydrolase [Clostridia bacterium]|nr:NUDIX hydrolase [Clostridia bacterium]
MNLKEETIETKTVYNGRVIDLVVDTVTLPNGKEAKREVVRHKGGVGVIAEDDNGNILFVKQFRYPYKEEIYEIPAGKRDSLDEEPIECGKRELREETGAVADEMISLGKLYPSPGYCGEIIWLFAAKGLEFADDQLDEDEFLNVERIPLEKAVEMVMKGEISDAKTQIAILKYKMMK